MYAHIPRDLAPIPFERVPITPLPDVIEPSGEEAANRLWLEWDAAVERLDANTPDGRARALAEA